MTANETSSPLDSRLLIDSVRIKGFRSLVDVRIRLEREVTFLVGENNSGKSSVLLAIATACGHRRPIIDDLHRAADGSVEGQATIDLFIRSRDDEFPDEVLQRLGNNAGSGPEPGEWTGIRTTLRSSREGTFLAPSRSFLGWNPADSDWVELGGVVPERVVELIAAQLLDASRDLVSDLGRATSDWSRVFLDLGISDADRDALEADLQSLSGRLRDASPIVGGLQDMLSQVANAQSGVDSIHLVPLPGDLEDLARSIDIVVASAQRPGLPLRLQGLGSRSLAALMVFRALCEYRVGRDRGIRPHIVTLLEEPEAHLHPQGQAAVGRLIDDMPGQTVVATHSVAIVAGANPNAIRRMMPDVGGARVHSLTIEGAKKMAIFRRFVERPLGEIFFARMVLFVDGTAERISLPVALDPLLGKDPAGAGVAIVDMEGMKSETLQKAIDALDELGGIPWIVFVDNDADGWSALEGVTGSDGSALDRDHRQVVVSGDRQLERLILDAGLEDEVRTVAEEYGSWNPTDPRYGQPRVPPPGDSEAEQGCLDFLKDNKGWAAELVFRESVGNRRAMPTAIVDLAELIRAELGINPPEDDRFRCAVGGATVESDES